jgi:hypothetical protein
MLIKAGIIKKNVTYWVSLAPKLHLMTNCLFALRSLVGHPISERWLLCYIFGSFKLFCAVSGVWKISLILWKAPPCMPFDGLFLSNTPRVLSRNFGTSSHCHRSSNFWMDNIYKISYTEFYHPVADLLIEMAEGTLGLALFCSAKNILWPPVQFFSTKTVLMASASQRISGCYSGYSFGWWGGSSWSSSCES